MTNNKINFIGWILFIVSAIAFIIASVGSFWSMFGSVFFLVACLIFLIPFSFIIFYTSLPFVADSYSILESSPDPGGLPYRFIIKSIIPIAFFLLMIQGILNAIKNYNNIKIKK